MEKFNVYDVRAAVSLFQSQKYQEALIYFLAIQRYSEKVMQDSPFLSYHIACCYDYLQNHLEAAFWIIKSKELDPFDSAIEEGAGIIFKNIECMLDVKIISKAPYIEVRKVYDFLFLNGRVTSATQFLFIRFLMVEKQYKEAKPLIITELLRNPNDDQLLFYRGIIAEFEGDFEVLKKCI
ncbi:MAG: tetratricopeptide (TPR) repeat protein [Thermoproteota archaeon]|jgi:tetratricopeptide (TPR) repeat protein